MSLMQFTFGDGKMVLPGQQLSINDIANEPKVEITSCKPTGIYSFLLVGKGLRYAWFHSVKIGLCGNAGVHWHPTCTVHVSAATSCVRPP
jgi:hypothetical protein